MNPRNSIKKIFAVLAVTAVVLIVPLGGKAYANTATACIDSADCGGGSTCSGGACTPVPELTDFLAAAFLLAAGGIIYYVRKRQLPAL